MTANQLNMNPVLMASSSFVMGKRQSHQRRGRSAASTGNGCDGKLATSCSNIVIFYAYITSL